MSEEHIYQFNDKLLHHHEKEVLASALFMSKWDEDILSGLRCGSCWLRRYDCYCNYVSQRKLSLEAACYSKVDVHVYMYYHYKEIGRSANTAHLLELLLPNSKITRLIYGFNIEKEKTMIEMIVTEIKSRNIKTCILYPTKTSKLLSEWMHVNNMNKFESSRDSESCCNREINTKMNIIALDGTYGQAETQFKYLKKMLKLASISHMPLVKLDLKNGYCMSMMTGLMSQVGKGIENEHDFIYHIFND